ncbi:MAG: hypothetical protein JWO24_2860, partial [Rhodospirillales bacterium]|nr:hypothetical protein [Rhodospirillales bacterium]
GQPFRGLPLPFANHRLVDAVLRRQLRRRQLTPQRLQRHLRLDSAEYLVRLPVIRVRPSRRRTELNHLPERSGPPQSSSIKARVKSIAADDPAEVMRDPSRTKIRSGSIRAAG